MFVVFIILSIIFFIGYFLYCKITGKQGTWSINNLYVRQPNNYSVEEKNDSKGEIECRRVLEHIFHKPFNKDRPNFLVNYVTGGNHNLELDCYNKDLKLAVEYQGEQHYNFIPYFHKNKASFQNQKYRDEIKRMRCKEQGITLIEVPYTVKLNDIYGFIKKELKLKYNKNEF